MSKWIRIAAVEDCPPGSVIEAMAEEQIIAVLNVEGRFFALDGICPHQGGPLGKGKLAGCILTCPWHGWQFDVQTGQNQINESITQPTLPVRVEKDSILVDLEP